MRNTAMDITVYAAENLSASHSNLFLYLKANGLLYPLRYSIIFIGLYSDRSVLNWRRAIYAAAGRQADWKQASQSF